MAHEAFLIACLCGTISFDKFNDDRPAFGAIWAVLCAGWAIVGVNRALA